ncbi:MAG: hypothetical protein J3T61_06630 [Candidatus Brocadiales bacterium]|nr:hypothetical protein [Candidatus Bathyanammoxibius sp.]
MSSKTTKKAPAVNKGAGKVAAAIAKVYEIVGQGGNIVTQLCKSANAVYKGETIPKRDLKTIADTVARLRNWSPVSAGPRKSEVRKMLRVYDRLPEAIVAYGKKHDTFPWHAAMKLARCLNREPSLKQALALMDSSKQADRGSPLTQVSKACSRLINIDTTAGSKARKFQDAVESLAESMLDVY